MIFLSNKEECPWFLSELNKMHQFLHLSFHFRFRHIDIHCQESLIFYEIITQRSDISYVNSNWLVHLHQEIIIGESLLFQAVNIDLGSVTLILTNLTIIRLGFLKVVFFWGRVQFDPFSYLKKNKSNVNMTLYNC